MFLIRNDDVAVDQDAAFLAEFCAVVDQYPMVKLLHAITPIGAVQVIEAAWDNDTIRARSGRREFWQNTKLMKVLFDRDTRGDLWGVHGLWHTHAPTYAEIDQAKLKIQEIGLGPTYYVPPFNEGEYDAQRLEREAHLTLLQFCPRLEEFHTLGLEDRARLLGAGVAYLHAWRYQPGRYFPLRDLDRCLQTLCAS